MKVVLEERWTTVDIADYERESALLPEPDRLQTVDGVALLKTAKGAEVVELLEKIRQERPSEPFFSGLVELTEAPGGVKMVFADSARPLLLPVVGPQASGRTPEAREQHVDDRAAGERARLAAEIDVGTASAPAAVACHLYG